MKKSIIVMTGLFVLGGAAVTFASGNPIQIREQMVTASNASVPEMQSQMENKNDSESILSKDEAIQIALDVLNGKVEEVELEKDDGRLYYEVEVKYHDDDFDFEIDAYTGEILSIDDNLMKTPVLSNMKISPEKAISLAIEFVSGGVVDDIELEIKFGRYVYEIELEFKDDDIDVYIDAMTGEVVYTDDDFTRKNERNTVKNNDQSGENNKSASNGSPHSEKITAKKAGELALQHIGNGYIDDIELETKHGKLVYEVEIENSNDDVEIYVDAYTGEIIYVDYD
ncbi:PepSY domain-containing protein [Alkalihalobacterium bogoriense]|uniref:PepSY domain-containing protein n=1 Tax=Alkalihalobacterium bogoriense TaxID=246272 RepID=UPI00047E00BA|nr:PepSY domain-containing protein [Alkalihalobacterium bogoriense]